ncbi:nickel ABC transporter, membrane protein NikMN [Geotalea daltonii FRC-32]|uniref:Nickel ABC transporter, membrane protein NikMN n=1 Tax=Geotalea daltonii (strain DSM 22248 / JCM 15807 / FRC-32) TaxID=316067 RepID=B9M047_GEODF|nr:nickel ABC transporter, membrane protein NikMN [Geotalea daltonii FRC-32]
MHMADALVSPAVGGTTWLVTAGAIAHAARRLGRDADERIVPLMGALGAFVFTVQMINFSIPGTGSSGHLVGGVLLAALLGPHGAFLAIASILVVQALVFADGGLLSLGCNILNLGFIPSYLAYPFIYKSIAYGFPGRSRIALAAVAAAVFSLVLGALAVVVETSLSQVSALPFLPFIALMLPVHLAIGVVEGMVTAALLSWLLQARPDLMRSDRFHTSFGLPLSRRLLMPVLGATIIIGGVLFRHGSERPDGLEWAMAKVAGQKELQGKDGDMHRAFARIQEKTALFPGYTIGSHPATGHGIGGNGDTEKKGDGAAGVVGGAITLIAIFSVGVIVNRRRCDR